MANTQGCEDESGGRTQERVIHNHNNCRHPVWVAAVCYINPSSRYSTALATIKSLDSPVILAISYVLDFVVSPV